MQGFTGCSIYGKQKGKESGVVGQLSDHAAGLTSVKEGEKAGRVDRKSLRLPWSSEKVAGCPVGSKKTDH